MSDVEPRSESVSRWAANSGLAVTWCLATPLDPNNGQLPNQLVMTHKKKSSLKARLQSQQSRLRAKEKAEHAANVAEKKQKKPKNGAKDKGLGRKPTVPFKPTDKILLIGEGNFSFARALVVDPPSSLEHLVPANVTATSYDSEEACFSKYPDAQAIVSTIKQRGAEVLFGIDATKLQKYPVLRGRRWDRIVWNFPHAGVCFGPCARIACLIHSRLSRKGYHRPGQEHSIQSTPYVGLSSLRTTLPNAWTDTSDSSCSQTQTAG